MFSRRMLERLLPNSFYVDEKIFKRERSHIFSKSWIFFCLIDEVARDGQYLRKTLFNQDIFVINHQDKLYGYFNICPHRFHPLIREDSGKLASIVCDYHKWAFKLDGKLKGIPLCEEAYQFSKRKLGNIALNSINVRVIGKFVFLNFSKKPIKIEKQFSAGLVQRLEEISEFISSVHTVRMKKQFNWKLIQENLRDPLHPSFVHPKTLAKEIDVGVPGIPKYRPFWTLRLKDASYGGPDVAILSRPAYVKHFVRPWPCEIRYYNFWLYPNLHLAAPDAGLTFVLENFIPLTPDSTQIELYYLIGQHDMPPRSYAKFVEELSQNSMRVYNEDFGVLEAIQKVVGGNFVRFPINGKFERMLTRFHKVYLNQTKLWLSLLKAKLSLN